MDSGQARREKRERDKASAAMQESARQRPGRVRDAGGRFQPTRPGYDAGASHDGGYSAVPLPPSGPVPIPPGTKPRTDKRSFTQEDL